MTCPSDDLLGRHARHGLEPTAAMAVAAHLEGCASCRSRFMALHAEPATAPHGTNAPTRADRPRAREPGQEPVPLGDPLPEPVARVHAVGAARHAWETLPRGAPVGRYVLLDRLGVGGMGEVYAAYDPVLDRKVAVKLLTPRATSPEESSAGRARLLREAQAMARLSHPNVVAVYDAGTIGERVFVAMELIAGATLRHWLMEAPREWPDTLAKLLDAGRGLAAAHAAGLVHRDFKPSNVLVGADGRARVSDFGIARLIDAEEEDERQENVPLPDQLTLTNLATPMTMTGAQMGTWGFMSPEQFRGAPVDARSDQYSFCVSAWEALYGVRPFNQKTPEALADAWARNALPEPPESSKVPPWVQRALRRGLCVEPADRFPSMEELLHELARDPTSTRRWLVRGAAAAAITLAVALPLVLQGRGGAAGCQDAPKRLEDVWGASARAAVRQAFIASGLALANDSFKRLETTLDTWAQAWGRVSADVCAASQVAGDRPPPVVLSQLACLETRRAELQALVGVLSSADPEVVRNSLRAAQGLPDPRVCEDLRALAMAVPPPATPEAQARVRELRARVAQAKARYEAGKYSEARADTAQAAADAKALGYQPVEAEALYWLARAQLELGLLDDARKTLLDALAAAESSGHDELVARSASLMPYLLGYRLGFAEEGERWGVLAQAAIDRLGGNDDIEAALLSNLGTNAKGLGLPARGVGLAQRALELRVKVSGPDHVLTGVMLNNLGVRYAENDRFTEAVDAYRRSLALFERVYGSGHPELIKAQMNLALALGRLGRGDEQLELGHRAVALAETTLGVDHPWTNTYRATLALMLVERRPAEALQVAQPCVRAEPPRILERDHLRCREAVASAHRRLGKHRDAIAECDEVTQARQRAAWSTGPELAFCLKELGAAHLGVGEAKLALPPLERAVGLLPASAPEARAEAAFWLARALWDSGGDRRRAIELATSAKALYAAAPGREQEVVELTTWLAGHAR